MANNYVTILENILRENHMDFDSLDALNKDLTSDSNPPKYLEDLLNRMWLVEEGEILPEIKTEILRSIRKLNGTYSDSETEIGLLLFNVLKQFPEASPEIEKILEVFDINVEDIKNLNDGSVSILGAVGYYTYMLLQNKKIDSARQILEFMEQNYKKYNDIRDAISTGFVEAIVNRISDRDELKKALDLMGPNLKEYAQAYLSM